MARTDANPPMMPYTDEYQLVEVDADYLSKAVKDSIAPSYHKTDKTHSFESIVSGESTAVMLFRLQKGAGKTTVHVNRKVTPYKPPKAG